MWVYSLAIMYCKAYSTQNMIEIAPSRALVHPKLEVIVGVLRRIIPWRFTNSLRCSEEWRSEARVCGPRLLVPFSFSTRISERPFAGAR